MTWASTTTCVSIEHERPVLVEPVGNAVIYRDPAKCILCGKCVRICADHQQVGAIEFAGRGFDTQVIPACRRADLEQ